MRLIGLAVVLAISLSLESLAEAQQPTKILNRPGFPGGSTV
jgi:hypothetical protein